jgi:tetratricopeptide (TPR) repeat protein
VATTPDGEVAPRYRLLELQLLRGELRPDHPAAIDDYWKKGLVAWSAADFDDAFFHELKPAISRLPDPAAAWREVVPLLPRIPRNQRTELVSDFTRAALAAGNPAVAAEAFAAGLPPARRTPAAALELARLWQLAGRNDAALEALGNGTAPELVARRIGLLRSLGRNREALALLRPKVEATGAAKPDWKAVEELATIAMQAGLPAEAVPAYRAYLAGHPDELEPHRRFRDLLVAIGQTAAAVEPARRAVSLGSRQPADLLALGRILEWSGDPRGAFDTWFELAQTGDMPAVDRLIELNRGLFRDDELRRALEKVVPVPGVPDYTLQLARVEFSLGRYEAATRHFARYLEENPAAFDIMEELGRLLAGMNRFDEAETWFRRVVAARPEDPTIQKELANLLVLQGHPNDALALFSRLAETAPTTEIFEAYAHLAESLGRYDELIRGLRRQIDHAATPKPRDYLMLAYGHELQDDTAGRRKALAEGLARLPGSDELRLQLASAQAEIGEYSRAQVTLSRHSHLRDEAPPASLFLELLRLNRDTATARTFLSEPLGPNLVTNENVMERVAHLWEMLHDYPAAERIWRQLLKLRPADQENLVGLTRVMILRGHYAEARAVLAPHLEHPTPALLRLAAEVAYATGDFRLAEKYQMQLLAVSPLASPPDWTTLGDIRLSRGDRIGARRAYSEALTRMKSQLAQTGGGP